MNTLPFLPFGPQVFSVLKPIEIFPKPQTLADHLYQGRKKKGLFQREVAKEMGVSLTNYISWELGRCGPQVKDWPKVIAWLGYDPIDNDGSLAKRVSALMRRQGLSQRDLSVLLGIHRDTVSDWMNGGIHKNDKRTSVAKQLLVTMIDEVLSASVPSFRSATLLEEETDYMGNSQNLHRWT